MIKPQQNNVLVYGASGSGKSFVFGAWWLVNDLLPFTNSTIYTNFPLGPIPLNHFAPPRCDDEWFLDRICDHVAAKHGGQAVDYSSRVRLLDEARLHDWRDWNGGPWDMKFEPDSFLILDEIGVYAHRSSPADHQVKWSRYLGEARHQNIRNLLLTQNGQKLSPYVSQECGERWLLSDCAGDIDPLTRVCIGDLQQLIAKFRGDRVGHSRIIPEINPGGGKWERGEPFRIRRDPLYFAFYNSFSAPDSGGQGNQRLEPYQSLSWWRLLRWFFARNRQFVFRVCCFLVFFLVGTAAVLNMSDLVAYGNNAMQATFRPKAAAAALQDSKSPGSQVDAVSLPRGRIGSRVVE